MVIENTDKEKTAPGAIHRGLVDARCHVMPSVFNTRLPDSDHLAPNPRQRVPKSRAEERRPCFLYQPIFRKTERVREKGATDLIKTEKRTQTEEVVALLPSLQRSPNAGRKRTNTHTSIPRRHTDDEKAHEPPSSAEVVLVRPLHL